MVIAVICMGFTSVVSLATAMLKVLPVSSPFTCNADMQGFEEVAVGFAPPTLQPEAPPSSSSGSVPPPPLCISYALVQATVGVGTVLIWYLI